MENKFYELIEKLGISRKFTDAAQNRKEYVTDDETLLKMVNYLGFNLKSTDESEKLLQKLDKERWLRVFEPIYVVKSEQKNIDIVLPEGEEYTLKIKQRSEKKYRSEEYIIKAQECCLIGKINYIKQ